MLVQLQKIIKNYGTVPVFENLDLQINEGEKIGFVGTNGSGKSTLLKILGGTEDVDSGIVSFKKNLKIGYLTQIHEESSLSVKNYLLTTFTELNELQKQLVHLEMRMASEENELESLLLQYGQKQEVFQQAGGYLMENRIEMVTNGLKINHLLASEFNELSGGEKKLVNLAKILVQKSDLLLLDEPTNHLDVARIEWLEGYLKHEKLTYIVISHDRLFLDHVTEKIIELDLGKLNTYQGNYSNYKEQKQVALDRLQMNYEQQKKEINKIKLTIRRYRQWGNESDNEKFFKKAKELEKRLAKIQQLSKPKVNEKKLRKRFKQTERSGKEVLQFQQVTKLVEQRPIFDNVSFSLYWQDRVAIIGENGVGKSTLLKMVLGEIKPTSGIIKTGSNLRIGYLAQTIEYRVPTWTMLQEMMFSCSLTEQDARHWLSTYSFYPEDVTKQLRFLSGGEKIRLELAKLMQQEINLLLLDEPTNHLDTDTREEIEELLSLFEGTLLIVSHDRFFLEKMFQTYFLIEEGKVKIFSEEKNKK